MPISTNILRELQRLYQWRGSRQVRCAPKYGQGFCNARFELFEAALGGWIDCLTWTDVEICVEWLRCRGVRYLALGAQRNDMEGLYS